MSSERVIDFGGPGKIILRVDLDPWTIDVGLLTALRDTIDVLQALADESRGDDPHESPGLTPVTPHGALGDDPAVDATPAAPEAIMGRTRRGVLGHDCDVEGCGATFSTEQGLAIHRGRLHPAVPIEGEPPASTDSALQYRCDDCDFVGVTGPGPASQTGEYQALYDHVWHAHQRRPHRQERRPRTAGGDLEGEGA